MAVAVVMELTSSMDRPFGVDAPEPDAERGILLLRAIALGRPDADERELARGRVMSRAVLMRRTW